MVIPLPTKTSFLLLTILSLSLLSGSVQAQLRPENVQIGPERDRDYVTNYAISDGEDHAELTVDRSLAAMTNDPRVAQKLHTLLQFDAWHEGDRYRMRAKTDLPISRKMELLRPLMERMFQTEKSERAYSFTIAGYEELGQRLLALASKSKEWNRHSGYSRQGHSFIVELLNHGDAYPELAQTVGEFNYQVRVSSVEKIMVLPVSRLTSEERASITGPVKNTDKFPANALIYFMLTRDDK